ncbi:MAG: porin family protein [Spirochaetota bacterium]|nr:porin family protein [Spirochaetota bacterium]
MKRLCSVLALACALSLGFAQYASAEGWGALAVNLGVVNNGFDEGDEYSNTAIAFGFTWHAYASENWGVETAFLYSTRAGGWDSYYMEEISDMHMTLDITVMYRHSFFCIPGIFTTFGAGLSNFVDTYYAWGLGPNVKAGMEWWFTQSLFLSADIGYRMLFGLEGDINSGLVLRAGLGFKV